MSSRLDVFLRGRRNYVQGTQLIARVAAYADADNATLVSSSFSAITDRIVMVRRQDEHPGNEPTIGKIALAIGHSDIQYVLIECHETAPQKDIDMGVSVRVADQERPMAATYSYTCGPALEDVLNAIVQSTKDLHERLGSSIKDVWFTGTRGLALPLRWKAEQMAGFIDVKGIRTMRQGEQHQSLVHVNLRSHDGSPLHNGHVLFAFKSDEAINAD